MFEIPQFRRDVTKEVKELQATNERQMKLLNKYKTLLRAIMGSNKASVGALENVYMPQFGRDEIDGLYAELAEELSDG